MEKFEKHPSREDDFAGNPETPDELEEAKRMAGVTSTTHKKVMERARELGLEEDDMLMVENAEREIEFIERELKAKDNLLSSFTLLDNLVSFIQNKEELKKTISGIDEKTEELGKLSQNMADMEIDTTDVIEKIRQIGRAHV